MTRVYQEIRMNALIEKVFEYPVPNPLLAPLEKLVLRCPLPAERSKDVYVALPLNETEEAALAFAACRVPWYALADLTYGRAQGGVMLAGLLGCAVASQDVINTMTGGPNRRVA
jgi:hypothetical protein